MSHVEQFIARWQGQTGGAERANYALFLTELCAVLGVAPPQPASAEHQFNDYVFERAVSFREAGDKIGHGRIDLYKRGHFVLEAKQSRQTGGAKTPDLGLGITPSPAIYKTKTRG
ncbi:MAG: type IIL restriction-modification enzyme MmeI [Devosia sp.]